MTDREPIAPADDLRPPLERSLAVMPSGEPNLNALHDSVSRGDGLTMSVTIVTRPSQRFSATDVSPADSVRAWLARLPACLHPFVPLDLSAIESATPAEARVVAHAAACPDVFVIHTPDPHAGERVIAEIARLAAGRVLILAGPGGRRPVTEWLARRASMVRRPPTTRTRPSVAGRREAHVDRSGREGRPTSEATLSRFGRIATRRVAGLRN